MSDDLVKLHVEWLRGDHDLCNPILADRIAALTAERDAMDKKVASYQEKDGMGGAVVVAIRELLNHHNVPLAAFIDDHVGNAIAQRDALAEKLERAVGALRIALDDLDEWCGCADSLTKAGFNIDDTAERTELCRATLAQITGETDGNL